MPRFREGLDHFDRRRFLQIMAAPMVMAALAGCGPEPDPSQLVPYVEQPPELVPSIPRHYATAFTNAGYAEGVLLKHLTGRPVKVEGNPAHPASLGAASAVMQASILSLYDPRRAQSITGGGQLQSWPDFVAALYARRQVLLRYRRKRPAGDDRHRDLPNLRGANRRPAAAVSGDAAGSIGSRSTAIRNAASMSGFSAAPSIACTTRRRLRSFSASKAT